MAEGGLTPEQLAEQIKALKVSDLLLSTVSTLGQLAYVKVDAKQLDEARLAIDSISALLPRLEGHVDEQLLRDFNQLLADVRLSYADASSASGSEPQSPEAPGSTSSPGPDADGERGESGTQPPQESASGSEPQSPGDAESRGDG